MPSLVNRLVVRELTGEFERAEGLIVVTWGGLGAKDNEGLRNKLAEKGCELKLVRNSLARLVLKERGYEVGADVLTGNVAIAYGGAEAVLAAAKILTSAEVKKVGKVKIRAGVLEGRLLGAADAEALSNVPDRRTLNGKVASLVVSGPRNVVGTLNAVPSSFVRLLNARASQLEKAGAS